MRVPDAREKFEVVSALCGVKPTNKRHFSFSRNHGIVLVSSSTLKKQSIMATQRRIVTGEKTALDQDEVRATKSDVTPAVAP